MLKQLSWIKLLSANSYRALLKNPSLIYACTPYHVWWEPGGTNQEWIFSRKLYMSWHWEDWFNSTVSTWFFDSKTQSHLSHLTALSQKGNILLPIWTLPRDSKIFHCKEKIVTIFNEGCSPELLWWSFCNIYQIIMYTWIQNNIICQYYLCIMIPDTEIAYMSMWPMLCT